MPRPRVSVHKFSSCDGCQLAILNLGEPLLSLVDVLDIQHFAEAGYLAEDASVDIAIVEGSISTSHEIERIKRIRAQSKTLIAIGACATSGGIQSLRNAASLSDWSKSIYANPEYIQSLDRAEPISHFVKVDHEIWGCPISSEQIVQVLRSYLLGVTPRQTSEKICLDCKRAGNICVLTTSQQACMGPITKPGCGSICPKFGRGCYHCAGPQETINPTSLAQRFASFGESTTRVQNRFKLIHQTQAKTNGKS